MQEKISNFITNLNEKKEKRYMPNMQVQHPIHELNPFKKQRVKRK